jgi:alginate O-acetyltransferase complex protein AlgI
LQRVPRVFQHGYALLAVIVGWVLFRAATLPQAGHILAKMFAVGGTSGLPVVEVLNGEERFVLVVAAALSVPLLRGVFGTFIAVPTLRPWPREIPAWRYAAGAATGLLVLGLASLKVLTGAYSPFIYFRF